MCWKFRIDSNILSHLLGGALSIIDDNLLKHITIYHFDTKYPFFYNHRRSNWFN